MVLYLLALGELCLKKGTRPFFEKKLKENIKACFTAGQIKVTTNNGRFYIEGKAELATKIEQVLKNTFGLVAFYKSEVCAKELETITQLALKIAQPQAVAGASFKIEARRTDKSFALTSYQLMAFLGQKVGEAYPQLKVNVKNPTFIINVEIREHAYLYISQDSETRGLGGLPVGTSGRALALLSGGIDSPVAAYLMMRRGLKLSFVHFHTPPYTSDAALAKVQRLAKLLAPYNGGSINFYAVNFTQLQLAIKQLKQEAYTTLLSRACMMQIATLLMQREGGEALITGEALAQVASQTLQALNFTDRLTTPLVLRPCVGMDKEDIVGLARKIGSFTLSIEAETDCCSLFAPQHPIISPNYNTTLAIFKQGNFDELITQLADQTKAQLIVAN